MCNSKLNGDCRFSRVFAGVNLVDVSAEYRTRHYTYALQVHAWWITIEPAECTFCSMITSVGSLVLWVANEIHFVIVFLSQKGV